jgi:hypothetical protein
VSVKKRMIVYLMAALFSWLLLFGTFEFFVYARNAIEHFLATPYTSVPATRIL